VSPAKAIIMLILFSNTLFHSVWASAHLVAEHHGAYEAPHIHINGDIDHQSGSSNEHSAESEDNHFHLQTLSADSDQLNQANLQNGKAVDAGWHSRNQTYSPPIPPPYFSA